MLKVHPITLSGHLIRLEPLATRHIPDLTVVGQDESIWRYMLYGDVTSEERMVWFVEELLRRQARGTDLPFTVILQATGRPIGSTRYMEIRPEHRGLEIGGTWYGVEYQGTGVNTEAKYLLFRHAFEDLGCIRVQIKTDLRNLRSQRAIERLGMVKEGVFRNHIITPDGTIRDSVYYSLITAEWPAAKTRLERLMAGSTPRL
ncbi:MAG: GNAT family N-acetyltransferase [Anaerolineae bacterium]|nr:GNAT family N-acetyltransferase [Anaerolineae bacterium]